MTPAEIRAPRVESLTGLRWWAAFAVFAHHMTNFAPLPIYPLLGYGTYGVTFFFVLSGFVLTWSSSSEVSPRTFWTRRWARIYPAYFVALVVAVPIFYTIGAGGQPWQKPFDPLAILLAVLLVQGWWTSSGILFAGNPAGWTLTVEALFYALHPALQRGLSRVSRRGALIAAAAILVIVIAWRAVAVADPAVAALPEPLLHLPDFLVGMCLAWALRHGWAFRVPPIISYVTGAAVVLGIYWLQSHLAGSPVSLVVLPFSNELIMMACAFAIVSVAARDMRGERSILRTRVLVLLGDLSYSFYLVHATVVYAFLLLLGERPVGWSNLGWYALVLVIAIGFSAALHFAVERPIEKRIRRADDARVTRKRQADASAFRRGPGLAKSHPGAAD
ncbi:MAG: acyltransferase [Pseudolysinimonas sp.]